MEKSNISHNIMILDEYFIVQTTDHGIISSVKKSI